MRKILGLQVTEGSCEISATIKHKLRENLLWFAWTVGCIQHETTGSNPHGI